MYHEEIVIVHWPLYQILWFIHHETNDVGDETEFDMAVEDFIFSTHLFKYLKRYIFLLSCGTWNMYGVSPVELEERCHKFGQILEYTSLGYHDEKHEAVDQLLCECFTHSFSTLTFVLLPSDYIQIHRAISCMFSPN